LKEKWLRKYPSKKQEEVEKRVAGTAVVHERTITSTRILKE
jgi:hypothetical protein